MAPGKSRNRISRSIQGLVIGSLLNGLDIDSYHKCPINRLPIQVLEDILDHLDHASLWALQQTSQKFRQLSKPRVWQIMEIESVATFDSSDRLFWRVSLNGLPIDISRRFWKAQDDHVNSLLQYVHQLVVTESDYFCSDGACNPFLTLDKCNTLREALQNVLLPNLESLTYVQVVFPKPKTPKENLRINKDFVDLFLCSFGHDVRKSSKLYVPSF